MQEIYQTTKGNASLKVCDFQAVPILLGKPAEPHHAGEGGEVPSRRGRPSIPSPIELAVPDKRYESPVGIEAERPLVLEIADFRLVSEGLAVAEIVEARASRGRGNGVEVGEKNGRGGSGGLGHGRYPLCDSGGIAFVFQRVQL